MLFIKIVKASISRYTAIMGLILSSLTHISAEIKTMIQKRKNIAIGNMFIIKNVIANIRQMAGAMLNLFASSTVSAKSNIVFFIFITSFLGMNIAQGLVFVK